MLFIFCAPLVNFWFNNLEFVFSFDWTFFMCLIVLGTWRLYNAMTESLAERRGDTQLDCVCCSCVFGLDWKITPPSLPSPCAVLQYFSRSCFWFCSPLHSNFTSLHSIFFPPCLFLPFLPIYQSLRLILPSSLPSYSQPDRELWGLCCWQPPNLLHNSTISLPESLLG